MVSLNFTTGKAKILDGSKEMTIRALRKRPIKVGDKLHLFWGMRTKNCKRLKEAFCLYETKLTWEEINILKFRRMLAVLDGFTDWYAMETWFREKHRPTANDIFQIICWGEEIKRKLEIMIDV